MFLLQNIVCARTAKQKYFVPAEWAGAGGGVLTFAVVIMTVGLRQYWRDLLVEEIRENLLTQTAIFISKGDSVQRQWPDDFSVVQKWSCIFFFWRPDAALYCFLCFFVKNNFHINLYQCINLCVPPSNFLVTWGIWLFPDCGDRNNRFQQVFSHSLGNSSA